MAVYEPDRARIVLRIVYDGPGRAGKTTNVEQLARIFGTRPGDELQVHPAATGRTIFFDWFSFDGGMLDGHQLQVQVVTVPGHKSLEPRRAHILRGADVVVLVCDSAVSGQDSAREMLDSLREHLGRRAEHVPLIVQANKQDLGNAMLPHELGAALGLDADVPVIGAQASAGIGVRETAVGAIRAAVRQMKQRTAREGLSVIEGRAGTAEELRAALQAIESVSIHRDPGRNPEADAPSTPSRPPSDAGRMVYIRSQKLVTQLAGDGEAPGRLRSRTPAPLPPNMSDRPAGDRPQKPRIPVSAMFIEPTPSTDPPDIPWVSTAPATLRVPPPPLVADAPGHLADAEPFDPEETRPEDALPLAVSADEPAPAPAEAPAEDAPGAAPSQPVPEDLHFGAARSHPVLEDIQLGADSTEPVPEDIGAASTEPVPEDIGAASTEPVPEDIGAAPTEPVLEDIGAAPTEPVPEDIGAAATEPVPEDINLETAPAESVPEGIDLETVPTEPVPEDIDLAPAPSGPHTEDRASAAPPRPVPEAELRAPSPDPSESVPEDIHLAPALSAPITEDDPRPGEVNAAAHARSVSEDNDTALSSPVSEDISATPSDSIPISSSGPASADASKASALSPYALADLSDVPAISTRVPEDSHPAEPDLADRHLISVASSSGVPEVAPPWAGTAPAPHDSEAISTSAAPASSAPISEDHAPSASIPEAGSAPPASAPVPEDTSVPSPHVSGSTVSMPAHAPEDAPAAPSADPADDPSSPRPAPEESEPSAVPELASDLAAPRPDLPPGHVWPVPGGRHVLERLAGRPLVQTGPKGHASSSMTFKTAEFSLRTRPEWRFADNEHGRAALREHVRRAARLGSLLPTDSAVALAVGADDHVLWHVVPDLPALDDALHAASADERPHHLLRLASAYAAALRLRAREGLALDLAADAFAEQDGRWVYLGDRLGEPEPAAALASALLRPPAGLPAPALPAWLDALEQTLPTTLTREDIAALGLDDALAAAAESDRDATARVRALLDRCA
ncbi:ADP-ribosylation factor-like protein [Nannocystis punicea]|uniref:ADP-ribosylation factor-like protein n=1 Tax=Nannocystis punicea TaxID=2995304 RepID=A0ABY7GV00_9BACT|nr:ADP-ribosylation factor-like protein [Nannocystis poenicansa]WAS90792.1 ADP-ribosylation factor-like protein [Nannocystis poenicansa]